MYKLTDLIWEFTSKCNKNCTFCGSKDIINSQDISYEQLNIIVQEIILQKDLEFLTITGGEPALNPLLPQVVETINKERPDIKVRILTNGLFLTKEECMKLLNNDSNGIGVSVNTISDIQYINNLIKNIKNKDKITMITNFGNHNFNDFFYLYDFSTQFGLWQIQLTIDDNLQLNSKKIYELYSLISNVVVNSNIVRADNFNKCDCTAGKSSCSITYNGEVIPCLSFRSWRKTLDVQGIINTKGDLTKIWNNKFNSYRQTYKCVSCKDITHIDNILSDNNILKKYNNTNFLAEDKCNKNKFNKDMSIAVYSVRINDDFNTPTC